MATILRIKISNPFGSIRWKIVVAFLFIVGISYIAIASSTIGLVGNYQLAQRMRNDKYSVEKMAVNVTQLFLNKDVKTLMYTLERLGGEYDCRLMLLDTNAKVQMDSYGKAEGMQINIKEVADALQNSQTTSYGIYHLNTKANKAFEGVGWINICTSSIVGQNGMEGILLYSSSIDDLMNNLGLLQNTILRYFIISAIASLLLALLFSSIITKPIAKLTQGIKKMGQGDFSIRVEEKGSSEIKKLSSTFNTMCEKLDNLEKSRNQFISNASHELKTPLATMKVLLESIIYQDDMDKGLQKEFLTDINNEIDRLNSIVKDLLTLVSLDNKSLDLSKSRFSLSKLVENVSKRMKLLSDKKDQEFITDIEEDCEVYGDSAKLQQVIYNLIDNAIKYTSENGIIEVKLYKTGKTAVLTVKDNGPGIPKEDSKNIFDRFYRVDKARSRGTGGTGLGLSIANQMVMLHGGTIYVNSECDQGSEFVVELPINTK